MRWRPGWPGASACPPTVTDALAHAYERWDGKGSPAGLAGDEVPFAIRVVAVARDVELWSRRGGLEAVTTMLRQRQGHAYDPAVVGVLLEQMPSRLAGMDGLDLWSAVLDAEPGRRGRFQPDGLDAALEAVADFGDLRSRWFRGHSRAVSALASAAAEVQGLAAADVAVVGRAGLVHDLGAVGVPAGIWDCPRRPLVERVGARAAPPLPHRADPGPVRRPGRRRRDGGRPPRAGRRDAATRRASARSMPAQLLAAADVYTALREDRPHRAALTEGEARRLLVEEADTGRLDRARRRRRARRRPAIACRRHRWRGRRA